MLNLKTFLSWTWKSIYQVSVKHRCLSIIHLVN